MEDDLLSELQKSLLPNADAIIKKIQDSANAYIKSDPDYNGCLGNARVALQTLARDIADQWRIKNPGEYNPEKWGQVIAFLSNKGFLEEKKQEEGITGVYSFISPGSHRPVGFSEQEFARLGRSFALSMCYFLVKQYNRKK